MKQFKLITSALVASALLAACSSEEAGQQGAGLYPISFKAAQAGSQGTRTAINVEYDSSIGEDVNYVVWSSGDTFTLFDAAGVNNTFKESGGAGTSVCTFNGTVTTLTPDWYALYPATPGAAISGSTITGAVLPAAQTAAADNFDPKANLQTAHTTTEDITFEHVAAYIKVKLLQDYTITFEGNDGEAVAGTIDLAVADNGTSTYTVTSPETKVTLTTVAPADGDYEKGKYYLLAILPQNFEKGFTIKCTDSMGKTICFKSTKAIEFEAGEIVNMGYADEDGRNWKEEGAAEVPSNVVAVDLGLPSGIKWANMNIGAENPEDFGNYYRWGETETQSDYSFRTYLANLGSTMERTDQYGTDKDPLKDFVYPNKVSFEGSQLDVAHVNWGDGWRMPTEAEIDELLKNCFWQWVAKYNGKVVDGYIVYKAKNEADKGKRLRTSISPDYSVSDPHIFLPCAGLYQGPNFSGRGTGYYLSATPSATRVDCAYILCIYGGGIEGGSNCRDYGQSVRAVHP